MGFDCSVAESILMLCTAPIGHPSAVVNISVANLHHFDAAPAPERKMTWRQQRPLLAAAAPAATPSH
jgi:hypothetical protein